MSKASCSVLGCDKHVQGDGLCGMHYMRLRRHGSLHPPTRKTGVGVLDRFWSRVKLWSATHPGCFEWVGHLSLDGYGSFRRTKSRMELAHRVSWELANGLPIPNGRIVRHVCDNPACVNPDHLILGTDLDNAQDKVVRGRGASVVGVMNPRAKISETEVREIRQSEMSKQDLASMYGVSVAAIHAILTRRNWAHVR